MSEADVRVVTSLEGDNDPLMQTLRASQQAIEAVCQKIDAMTASPTVTIDAQKLMTSWQAALTQMQAAAQTAAGQIGTAFSSTPAKLTVTADTTQAQAQLQRWVSTVQTINISMTVPNAAAIGAEIGNAAAQAFIAGTSGMGGGGGGSGGGLDGGGDGRGGGGSTIGGLPIGRSLTAMMLLRQGIEWAEKEQKYTKSILNAGGDESKILQAEIEHRTDHDSAVFGLGRVGRAIRENTWDAWTGGATVEELEKEQREAAASEKRYEEMKQGMEFGRGVAERFEAQTAGTTHEREQITQRQESEKRLREIDTQAAKGLKEAEARFKQKMADADIEGEKWAKGGEALGEHAATAGKMRDEASKEYAREVKPIQAQYGRETEQEKASSAAELERLKKKQSLETYEGAAGVRGAESETYEDRLRQSGAGRAADSGAYARKLTEEIQLIKARAGATADATEKQNLFNVARAKETAMPGLVAEHEAAGDRAAAASRGASRLTIRGEHVAADAAELRAGGQTRAASDLEFSARSQDHIDSLRNRVSAAKPGTPEYTQAQAELSAAEAERPRLQAAHKTGEDRQDQQELTRLDEQANEQKLRLAGQFYEADLAAAKDHYAARIKLAEDNKQPEVVKRLQELQAGAIAEAEQKHTESIEDIQERTREKILQNTYQPAGAELSRIQYESQKQLRHASGDPAMQAAIRGETEAAIAEAEQKHTESIEDIQERTREKILQNTYQPAGAELSRIQYESQKQLRHASGDPAMQAAIRGETEADLQGFIKGNQGKPGFTDAEGYWKLIQEGIFRDASGGRGAAVDQAKKGLTDLQGQDAAAVKTAAANGAAAKAAAVKTARQKALGGVDYNGLAGSFVDDLSYGLQPDIIPGLPTSDDAEWLKNNVGGSGAAGHGSSGDQTSNEFGDAAGKLSDAADQITQSFQNAKQLYVVV